MTNLPPRLAAVLAAILVGGLLYHGCKASVAGKGHVQGETNMQAVFRFHGAEEIIVSNQVNGVLVEYKHGYASQCEACRASGPSAGCANCPKDPHQDLVPRAAIHLSKSEARSVASAMMGAAAEL